MDVHRGANAGPALHGPLIFNNPKRTRAIMQAHEDDGIVVKRIGLLAAVLAAGVLVGLERARAVVADPMPVSDVIQVLADLTAIDLDCRDLSVNFGVGFRFAEDQGLAPATVLPTGTRRAAFEKAFQATQSAYDASTVCSVLAHHYSVALPGSITFSAAGHDGS